MRDLLNIQIGDVFGDLQCINFYKKRTGKYQYINTYYVMECLVCGRTKDMLSSTIRDGRGITHKACGRGLKTVDPVFYSRWEAMRTRTTNINYAHADHYLLKGIDSNDFKYFIDFYDAMYSSYRELADVIGDENVSLERIDNNKGYTKDNCIWIDKHDQPKNTSRVIKFKVVYPDELEEITKDVNEFARNHNLDASNIIDCMNGKKLQGHYKNYVFIRLDE